MFYQETAMKRSLGPAPLAYPMPAFLVATYDAQGKANVMTAAWGGICCSEPPCIMVSVRPQRWTFQALSLRKAFTVGVASCAMAVAADHVGIACGEQEDKFARTGLTAVRSTLVDAPYVDECPVVLECALLQSLELGSHTQFIGKILDARVREDCLTPDGKPDAVKIDPLIFDAGQGMYYGLGRVVGKAFSIGRTSGV
jgi:flavin reductase (DIM6/NTAB) family NADH-FMN oxidoreductase RutF